MQWPYSMVLNDEVKKGNDAVTNLFPQILDDGRLTDSKGRTVDFTNTIIIMTSNLGAHHLTGDAAGCPDAARERVIADVQKHFRPELINRLDEMVVFRPLSGDTLREVVKLQLGHVAARLADSRGIGLDVTDGAADVVLSKSTDQVAMYGARPIKRCLQNMVMTRISRMIVQGEVEDGCNITIDAADDMEEELVFNVKKPEKIIEAPPLLMLSPPSVKDCEISVLDADEPVVDNKTDQESPPPLTNEDKPTSVKDCEIISAFDVNEPVPDKTDQESPPLTNEVKPASVKDCEITSASVANEPVPDKTDEESPPLMNEVKPASVKECEISVLDANEPILDKTGEETNEVKPPASSALKKRHSPLTRVWHSILRCEGK